MSALYGTLTNDKSGNRNCCAHHQVTAAARSYDGSVSVTLLKDGKDDAPTVIIEVGEGSRVGGREVWRGPLASLLLQGLLNVQPGDGDPDAQDRR